MTIRHTTTNIKLTPFELGEWFITVGEWPPNERWPNSKNVTVQFVNRDAGTAAQYCFMFEGDRITNTIKLFGKDVSPAILVLMRQELLS